MLRTAMLRLRDAADPRIGRERDDEAGPDPDPALHVDPAAVHVHDGLHDCEAKAAAAAARTSAANAAAASAAEDKKAAAEAKAAAAATSASPAQP